MITYLRRIPGRLGLALLKFALRHDAELARTWHGSIEHVARGAWQIKTSPGDLAHRIMKRLFDVERPKP